MFVRTAVFVTLASKPPFAASHLAAIRWDRPERPFAAVQHVRLAPRCNFENRTLVHHLARATKG